MTFKYVYITFSCLTTKNLAKMMYAAESSARENANEYFNPSVELATFQKVGFFTYLTVWKIKGYFKGIKE